MFSQKLNSLACKNAKYMLILVLVIVPLTFFSKTVFAADNMQHILKLMADKKWQQAETELIKQRSNKPNNIAVYNNLAITSFHLNKLAKARQYFIKALESNPQTKTAFRNLLQLNSVQQSKRQPFFTTLKGVPKRSPSKLTNKPIRTTKRTSKPIKSNTVVNTKPNNVSSKAITTASKDEFTKAAKNLEKRPPMAINDVGKEDDFVAQLAAEQPSNSLLNEINQEINMEVNFDDTVRQDNMAASDNSYLDDLFSEDTTVFNEVAPEAVYSEPVDKELENTIVKRIQDWSATWSAGEVNNYFTFYSADYSPGKQSRKTWMKTRRSRISPEREIKVTISDISVSQGNNSNLLKTRFLQKYRAKSYRDIGYKTIQWEKQNGTWVIVKEKSS